MNVKELIEELKKYPEDTEITRANLIPHYRIKHVYRLKDSALPLGEAVFDREFYADEAHIEYLKSKDSTISLEYLNEGKISYLEID